MFNSIRVLFITALFSAFTFADLFFSEYAEGSSNNKYLEIYNGTGQSVGLSSYLIRYSQNGATAWSSSELGLSGTLLGGDVYVVAHASADASILAEADTTESSISNFNCVTQIINILVFIEELSFYSR